MGKGGELNCVAKAQVLVVALPPLFSGSRSHKGGALQWGVRLCNLRPRLLRCILSATISGRALLVHVVYTFIIIVLEEVIVPL